MENGFKNEKWKMKNGFKNEKWKMKNGKPVKNEKWKMGNFLEKNLSQKWPQSFFRALCFRWDPKFTVPIRL